MRTRLRGAVALCTLLLTVSACSTSNYAAERSAPFLGHVHALGVTAEDDRVYVATHNGLYTAGDEGLVKVGTRSHDLMGLLVNGAGEFLASGHPDTPDLPNPLGLVRSEDRGLTWKEVSLGGTADLHSIDANGSTYVALDGTTEQVVRLVDGGKTSLTVADVEGLDLAVDSRGFVMVTRAATTPVMLSDEGMQKDIASAPHLQLVDWEDGVWAGVDGRGRSWSSANGFDWERRGAIPGSPQALLVSGDRWLAATTSGLFESTDGGHAWKSL